MDQKKRWRVVLDAEEAPAVEDWVAIDGLVPGEEERPRFTFLDNSKAKGLTVREGVTARGAVPTWQDWEERHANGKIPWLHFPDCMKIVDIQRLDLHPRSWEKDHTLWLLTVESLPSNIAFEMRFIEEQERQRKSRSRVGKFKEWWASAFVDPPTQTTRDAKL